jgi:anti-sigma regulatory factor (Ser/Thr protein kinase)/virulence-associated protein VapD
MREKTLKIQDFILSNIGQNQKNIGALTSKVFGISRQAVSHHIRKLVKDGLVEAVGQTRKRTYKLKVIVSKNFTLPINSTLAEDKVWREKISELLDSSKKNIKEICQYGFTEMFNNVLDHSEANLVMIHVSITAVFIEITVFDNGIGIFKKIMEALHLDDQRHAILELAKGKLTTDPERHSGEGIFFTSRMFDGFSISSDDLFFGHRSEGGDWLIENMESEDKGTFITMKISKKSEHNVKEVFDKFSPELEEFGFTKTHLPVSLVKYGDEKLVSRSQAKRLLARFDKFKEVFLDFKGISSIGQAFADEIFRVFAKQNPNIKIVCVNSNETIQRMINKYQNNQ